MNNAGSILPPCFTPHSHSIIIFHFPSFQFDNWIIIKCLKHFHISGGEPNILKFSPITLFWIVTCSFTNSMSMTHVSCISSMSYAQNILGLFNHSMVPFLFSAKSFSIILLQPGTSLLVILSLFSTIEVLNMLFFFLK